MSDGLSSFIEDLSFGSSSTVGLVARQPNREWMDNVCLPRTESCKFQLEWLSKQ